jgi:hypothetical protein
VGWGGGGRGPGGGGRQDLAWVRPVDWQPVDEDGLVDSDQQSANASSSSAKSS